MRKIVVAILSAIVVGLMLVPSGVSAGTKMVTVPDRTGDLCKHYNWSTGEPRHVLGDNTPVVKAGYFDIVSVWLVQTGETYKFGMKLAANLPQEGKALPCGMSLATWQMIIESAGPWDPYNPLPFAYFVTLTYDGSSYSAILVDVGAGVMTPLQFTHDGPKFQMVFSEDSIGSLSTFWWSFDVEVYFGAGGWSMPDNPDPGASPGQVYWDIPWPPQ